MNVVTSYVIAILVLVFLGVLFSIFSWLNRNKPTSRKRKDDEENVPADTEVTKDITDKSDPPPSDILSHTEEATEISRQAGIREWLQEFWLGMSTEMFGAVGTTILLTMFIAVIQENDANAELRRNLIRDMGSSDNGFALQALDQIRENGWLFDDSFVGASLKIANLSNADLSNANLVRADLRYADLSGSNLTDANLQGADLRYAIMRHINTTDIFDVDEVRQALLDDLQRIVLNPLDSQMMAGIALRQAWAYSNRANLQNADLRGADLSGSDLSFADMRGANLLGANLSNVNLFMADMRGAIIQDEFVTQTANVLMGQTVNTQQTGEPPILDTYTILPNGQVWFPNVDMTTFTDEKNQKFVTLVPECRALMTQDNLTDIEFTAPIRCGFIAQTIPYPERSTGPIRDNAINQEIRALRDDVQALKNQLEDTSNP